MKTSEPHLRAQGQIVETGEGEQFIDVRAAFQEAVAKVHGGVVIDVVASGEQKILRASERRPEALAFEQDAEFIVEVVAQLDADQRHGRQIGLFRIDIALLEGDHGVAELHAQADGPQDLLLVFEAIEILSPEAVEFVASLNGDSGHECGIHEDDVTVQGAHWLDVQRRGQQGDLVAGMHQPVQVEASKELGIDVKIVHKGKRGAKVCICVGNARVVVTGENKAGFQIGGKLAISQAQRHQQG